MKGFGLLKLCVLGWWCIHPYIYDIFWYWLDYLPSRRQYVYTITKRPASYHWAHLWETPSPPASCLNCLPPSSVRRTLPPFGSAALCFSYLFLPAEPSAWPAVLQPVASPSAGTQVEVLIAEVQFIWLAQWGLHLWISIVFWREWATISP